jgi:hypothetical protein
LAVEAGKSYEILQNTDNLYDLYFEVYRSCGGDYVTSGYCSNGLFFSAPSTGEYIIWLDGHSSSTSNQPVSWQVNESSAYATICTAAVAVTADDTVQVQAPNNTGSYFWYKFTATSGKTYQITHTSPYVCWVYDGCEGEYIGFPTSPGTYFFTASSGGDYYIKWYVYNGSLFDWVISEYTPPAPTNTTCAAAEQVELDTVTFALVASGQPRWYKFEVTAGSDYVLYKLEDMSLALYTACGQNAPALSDSSSSEKLTYHANQTGMAYLRFDTVGFNAFMIQKVVEGAICEMAKPITLDATIQTSVDSASWYSIAVEPEYLYTLSGISSGSSSDYGVYDGCGNDAHRLGYAYDGNPLIFSVSSARTCYIEYRVYSLALNQWSVSRSPVEGNLVCTTAEPAPLNTATTTTVEAGKTYWYSFFGEPGKFYEISDCGGASFDTYLSYGSCEALSSQDDGCGYNHERVVVTGKGELIYFGWRAYSSGTSGSITWTVSEILPDNRVCAYAELVNSGDTVHSTLGRNMNHWYRFTAQAGKTYEILRIGNGSDNAYFRVLSGTCDDYRTMTNGYAPFTVQVQQAAVYYIECWDNSGTNTDYTYSWQVREVTDKRICANATAVATGGQVSNTHVGGNPLWYAFTAPTAGQYDIIAPPGQQLRIVTGCQSSTTVVTGVGSATFTATAAATYYIEWIAAVSYEYSYTWSIIQHIPAALTALSVLNYPLSPAFIPQTESYRVNVPNSEATVTIAAETPSGVTITGDVGVRAVNIGDNPFIVTASANDISKSYTITVHRAAANASNVATLSDLAVSAGSLAPAFSADVTRYEVSVTNAVSSINISAAASHAGALVSDTGTYSLNVGSGNIFPITVVAEDGTQLIYTIAVTRANPPAPAEVLNVVVTPAEVSLQKGAQQQFAVDVCVTGDAAQTVTWSVTGNASTGTDISATGLLTVAANETATTITIIATSTADPTKSDTATVTVEDATGVESRLTISVALYPNPFADELHLAGAEGCTLRIINTSGATVYSRLLTSSDEVIQLENLPSGLYFFQLEKDGKTKTLQAAKR